MLSQTEELRAPFPYFGGKSRVAHLVWQALGDVRHYIEPFFGSGAVLLARPDYAPTHHVETVCDKDGMLCNVWRALQHDPDAVARYCDWPVNHADLSARNRRLIAEEPRLLERLIADDEWYDAKLAGYWIWAASCWIGSGLMSPGQRPHLSDAGQSVHRIGKIPHLSNAGQGVHRLGEIPHVGDAGQGVHRISQRPHLSHAGQGVHRISQRQECSAEEAAAVDVGTPYNPNIYRWFRALAERLRYVRVVCGDWTRVCGGKWQDKLGTCGIFFDPPYSAEGRDPDIYHHDDQQVARRVAEWALERGRRETYRIVIAGYYDEHAWLLDHGWTMTRWTANGGYANVGPGDSAGKRNRFREALFFSPHCLRPNRPAQLTFLPEPIPRRGAVGLWPVREQRREEG